MGRPAWQFTMQASSPELIRVVLDACSEYLTHFLLHMYFVCGMYTCHTLGHFRTDLRLSSLPRCHVLISSLQLPVSSRLSGQRAVRQRTQQTSTPSVGESVDTSRLPRARCFVVSPLLGTAFTCSRLPRAPSCIKPALPPFPTRHPRPTMRECETSRSDPHGLHPKRRWQPCPTLYVSAEFG